MNEYIENYVPEYVYFLVGIKVVVFDREGKVLLLRRSEKCSRAGGWDFPGGGLEKEDLVEGLMREMEEETGIEVADEKLVYAVTHTSQTGDPYIILGYKVKAQSNVVTLSWEHDQYRWVMVEEALAEVRLPYEHKEILKMAANVIYC